LKKEEEGKGCNLCATAALVQNVLLVWFPAASCYFTYMYINIYIHIYILPYVLGTWLAQRQRLLGQISNWISATGFQKHVIGGWRCHQSINPRAQVLVK